MGFLWLLSLSSRFLGFFGTCVPMSAQTHSSDGLGLPSLGFRMIGWARFLFALLNLPDGEVRRATELSDPLWAEFPSSASAPKAPALTWNPRRLAVRLGSGAPPSRMAKASSFSMPAISLLLRQEGRGRVLFAGHSVPQGGTASGDAERI